MKLSNYDVGADGKIWSHSANRFLKQSFFRGYARVLVVLDGKRHILSVSQLVATKFVPNPCNYSHVGHVDGDKTNNQASNLEWVAQSAPRRPIAVCRYGLDGSLLTTYRSMLAAQKDCGCSTGSVSKAIAGKIATAGGWQWRLASAELPQLPAVAAHHSGSWLVRNLSTGQVFTSKQLTEAGHSVSAVCNVVAGRRRTTGSCQWERVFGENVN